MSQSPCPGGRSVFLLLSLLTLSPLAAMQAESLLAQQAPRKRRHWPCLRPRKCVIMSLEITLALENQQGPFREGTRHVPQPRKFQDCLPGIWGVPGAGRHGRPCLLPCVVCSLLQWRCPRWLRPAILYPVRDVPGEPFPGPCTSAVKRALTVGPVSMRRERES